MHAAPRRQPPGSVNHLHFFSTPLAPALPVGVVDVVVVVVVGGGFAGPGSLGCKGLSFGSLVGSVVPDLVVVGSPCTRFSDSALKC